MLIDINIFAIFFYFALQVILPLVKGDNFEFPELGQMFIKSGFFILVFGFPVLWLLYQAFFESSHHQGTPGKIAVNIKFVNKEGNRISFLQAFGRNAGKLISGMTVYIGFFMVIWTERKQALHDMMADTYIVVKD